jgi:hypothetical protein
MLTESKVFDFVRTSLGAEDVAVELTDHDLKKCVDLAMLKYSRYNPLQNREAKFVPPQTLEGYDLPPFTYNVIDIQIQDPLRIFETLNSQEFNLFNSWHLQRQGYSGGISNAEEYALTVMWRELTQRVYSLEPDYYVDWDRQVDEGGDDETRVLPKKIYFFNPTGLQMRVSYMALRPRPLERVEPMDEDWVEEYALAHAKEILGRKRGKFRTIPNAGQPLELDGMSLLQEAKAEKAELTQDLKDRTHYEYPIWG